MKVHEPVLLKEVITYLKLRNGDVILDATVGCGGHAAAIIEHIKPDGLLIGIDRDKESLKYAQKKLASYDNSLHRLIWANFRDIDFALKEAGVNKVNGVLLDLGVSSLHFDSADRGFSIKQDGPLDMRMDTSGRVTASL